MYVYAKVDGDKRPACAKRKKCAEEAAPAQKNTTLLAISCVLTCIICVLICISCVLISISCNYLFLYFFNLILS